MSPDNNLWLQNTVDHYQRVVEHYARLAGLLGADELATALHSQIAALKGHLGSTSAGIRSICEELDARLKANAKAALLVSKNAARPSRQWTAEDVALEAALYRQEAELTDDPERMRALAGRALEMARLAVDVATKEPPLSDAKRHNQKRRISKKIERRGDALVLVRP